MREANESKIDGWSSELETDICNVHKIIVEISNHMWEKSLSFEFCDNLISMTQIMLEYIRVRERMQIAIGLRLYND